MKIETLPLVTPRDAARILGVSTVTLARHRCYGKPDMPPFVRMGRIVRYAISDLEQFIESRKVGGAA